MPTRGRCQTVGLALTLHGLEDTERGRRLAGVGDERRLCDDERHGGEADGEQQRGALCEQLSPSTARNAVRGTVGSA